MFSYFVLSIRLYILMIIMNSLFVAPGLNKFNWVIYGTFFLLNRKSVKLNFELIYDFLKRNITLKNSFSKIFAALIKLYIRHLVRKLLTKQMKSSFYIFRRYKYMYVVFLTFFIKWSIASDTLIFETTKIINAFNTREYISV